MEMALRLPSSYVEVERDEMEYLDGGGGAFVQIAAVILAGVIVASAIALATIYLSGGSITLSY